MQSSFSSHCTAGNFYSWGDISKLNELIDVKRSLLGNSEEILGLDRESILGVSLRSLVHQRASCDVRIHPLLLA